MKIVVAGSWFDGERHHATPVSLLVAGGRLVEVAAGLRDGPDVQHVPFVMPGLVEAHAHLFLDGGQLDFDARTRYLEAPLAAMLDVGRANLARTRAAGITLVRDAGDRYGVNHALRAGSRVPAVRSAGIALRRPRRYGGFMAREVASDDEIRAAVRAAAASGADDLKIIQTGIIDFESGSVKGGPQFDLESLSLIVRLAREAGLRTFAHCSGTEGIAVAVAAGVDSIEHGFFVDEETLHRMAGQGTAWVPTFSPVDFQRRRPEVAGWSAATVARLEAIVERHRESVALAARLGVNLVAGSDAGSPGVEHGDGLIAEIETFLGCGLAMTEALVAATTRPRRLWGAEPAEIRPGARADLAFLAGDPFDDPRHLRGARGVLACTA